MWSVLRRIHSVLYSCGIDIRKFFLAIAGAPQFVWNLGKFVALKDGRGTLVLCPMLSDRFSNSGVARGHYFHVDLWAAKFVYRLGPHRLVDVGSRVDGFISHILVFREVVVVDIRQLKVDVPGLHFVQADVMAKDFPLVDYADCVSSLHALEHLGLGRYGDPVDPDGWKKGFENITGVLKVGGTLLLAVPVGRERVEFDAHRVFDPNTIAQYADSIGLRLTEFSYVGDDGLYYGSGGLVDASKLTYGCGCFAFIKS